MRVLMLIALAILVARGADAERKMTGEALACTPGDETWTVTVGPRTTTCCVRHISTRGNAYALDDLVLWCPRTPRPSVAVYIDILPETGQPGVGTYTSPNACQVGPRLRRPLGTKPWRPHRSHCCPLVVTSVTGPVSTERRAGSDLFVPIVGRVTAFSGMIECGHRQLSVAAAGPTTP